MKRTLEVRPASDGTPRYTYKVNGDTRAYGVQFSGPPILQRSADFEN